MIKIERSEGMVVFHNKDHPNRELGRLPAAVFGLAMESVQEIAVAHDYRHAAITIYMNQQWSLVLTNFGCRNDSTLPTIVELQPRTPPKYTVDWLPDVPTGGEVG